MLDEAGNLIWYYDFGPTGAQDSPFPFKLLQNGHFLVNVNGPDFQGFREIDLAGNTIREVSLQTLNQELAAAGSLVVAIRMHHDILPLASGHIVVLINQNETFTNLPGFRGQTTVVGDALMDLDQWGSPCGPGPHSIIWTSTAIRCCFPIGRI